METAIATSINDLTHFKAKLYPSLPFVPCHTARNPLLKRCHKLRTPFNTVPLPQGLLLHDTYQYAQKTAVVQKSNVSYTIETHNANSLAASLS